MRSSILPVLGLALLISSCGNGTTSPTTTTTRTPAEARVRESFVSTVAVGGSRFYSFSVAEYGTVNLILNDVRGAFEPGSVMLGLGIGTPSGTTCATTSTTNAAPGTDAQVTGAYEAGIYCAKVSDIGNLTVPAAFDVTVAHP